ncbi:MAG TPA: hypothetical protein VIJ14_04960 [Rhabdochlamydiaceae bacterium]
MNQLVNRPEASKTKIKTSEDFELCFLRHQYFRRVKYNPTEKEMQPFMAIVTNLTKNTYFTYFNLFKAVGMYHDDILNIGRVHLVSFLGLYSLNSKPDKKKEFTVKYYIDKGREPTENDLLDKDKANLTCFFKQRMEDLVRVCRQKVRNIKGQPSEEYSVFCGGDRPPKYPRKLLRDYEEHGYKKIDFSIFKSIRKKANVNHDATIFEFGGLWYVAIALDQKNLELEDIVGSGYDPYENTHNMQPDELFERKESEQTNAFFNQKSVHKKQIILRKFVAKHKNKAQYREEVVTARKLLRSLGD